MPPTQLPAPPLCQNCDWWGVELAPMHEFPTNTLPGKAQCLESAFVAICLGDEISTGSPGELVAVDAMLYTIVVQRLNGCLRGLSCSWEINAIHTQWCILINTTSFLYRKFFGGVATEMDTWHGYQLGWVNLQGWEESEGKCVKTLECTEPAKDGFAEKK